MSPRSCRTLRGLHDGPPKQRGARRVFVEVGNRASALRAAARFPRERRSAPVDALRYNALSVCRSSRLGIFST